MSAEDPQVAYERGYDAGQRRAYLSMLRQALSGLGRDGPEWPASRLVLEREEAIVTLRRICAEHDDNEWPDDLHLADIIEKHLARHLS